MLTLSKAVQESPTIRHKNETSEFLQL